MLTFHDLNVLAVFTAKIDCVWAFWGTEVVAESYMRDQIEVPAANIAPDWDVSVFNGRSMSITNNAVKRLPATK